jgi:hypothetical protein
MDWYKESQNNYENLPDSLKGGDCFTDAFNYIFTQGVLGGRKDLQLVHAIICPIMGRLEGVTFGHAWVEDGDKVIDTSRSNQELKRENFYMIGGLINLPNSRNFQDRNFQTTFKEELIHRYSVEEAQEMSVDHNGRGPWETKFDEYIVEDEESDGNN